MNHNTEELRQLVAPFGYRVTPYFGYPQHPGIPALLWPVNYEALLHEDVVLGLVTLAGYTLVHRIDIQITHTLASTHKVGLIFSLS